MVTILWPGTRLPVLSGIVVLVVYSRLNYEDACGAKRLQQWAKTAINYVKTRGVHHECVFNKANYLSA